MLDELCRNSKRSKRRKDHAKMTSSGYLMAMKSAKAEARGWQKPMRGRVYLLWAIQNIRRVLVKTNDDSGGDYDTNIHSCTLSSTPTLSCCRIGFRHVAMFYPPISSRDLFQGCSFLPPSRRCPPRIMATWPTVTLRRL